MRSEKVFTVFPSAPGQAAKVLDLERREVQVHCSPLCSPTTFPSLKISKHNRQYVLLLEIAFITCDLPGIVCVIHILIS